MKPLLRHGLAERGDQLRAAQEDGQRLGIAEQVDVALAVALFLVGQAVPLLGRGEQALGQERQLLGEDGQLAGLGMAEAAVDADQIAQVELFDQAPAEIADLLLADEDLDVIGPVAKVEEDDLPLPAPEHDPPGDADGRAGLLALGSHWAPAARAPRRSPGVRRIAGPMGPCPGSAIRSSFSSRTSSRLSRGSSGIVPLTSFRFITSGEVDPNCSVPCGPVNGNRKQRPLAFFPSA